MTGMDTEKKSDADSQLIYQLRVWGINGHKIIGWNGYGGATCYAECCCGERMVGVGPKTRDQAILAHAKAVLEAGPMTDVSQPIGGKDRRGEMSAEYIEALEEVARAARGILPEVAEAELGSAVAAGFEEGRRIVKAKGERWERLRAALSKVDVS